MSQVLRRILVNWASLAIAGAIGLAWPALATDAPVFDPNRIPDIFDHERDKAPYLQAIAQSMDFGDIGQYYDVKFCVEIMTALKKMDEVEFIEPVLKTNEIEKVEMSPELKDCAFKNLGRFTLPGTEETYQDDSTSDADLENRGFHVMRADRGFNIYRTHFLNNHGLSSGVLFTGLHWCSPYDGKICTQPDYQYIDNTCQKEWVANGMDFTADSENGRRAVALSAVVKYRGSVFVVAGKLSGIRELVFTKISLPVSHNNNCFISSISGP